MNVIDEQARPYLTALITGQTVILGTDAQAALATWVAKVILTSRSSADSRLPIEEDWSDWLYRNHSVPPHWYVWVGQYVGTRPFWFHTDDISVQPPSGASWSASSGPIFIKNGVLATLALGYLLIQILGTGGGTLVGLDPSGKPLPPEEAMIGILPMAGNVNWPPPKFIDDAGLPLWAGRFIQQGGSL